MPEMDYNSGEMRSRRQTPMYQPPGTYDYSTVFQNASSSSSYGATSNHGFGGNSGGFSNGGGFNGGFNSGNGGGFNGSSSFGMGGAGDEDMVLPGANTGGASSMTAKGKFLFGLLCGAAISLHLDLQMAAPHLSWIAKDFGLTPMEKDTRLGGMVQFGFFLLGGVCSLVVGPLADKMDRVILLSGILAFSATLNLITSSFVTNSKAGFFYFFLLRVLTGISIGGCFPVLYSLCGDLFSSSQRAQVAATIGSSAGIGAALGSILSGMIGGSGFWRLPYFLACLAQGGFCCAAFMFLKDPRTEARKAVTAAESSGGEQKWANAWSGAGNAKAAGANPGYVRMEDLDFMKFRDIMVIPTNKYLLLQAIPGCVPISLILTFLPDYLTSEMGMSVKASVAVQTAFGLSGLALSFLGGTVGQHLYARSKESYCNFISCSTAMGVLPFVIMINLSPKWIASGGTPAASTTTTTTTMGNPNLAVPPKLFDDTPALPTGGSATFLAILLALWGGVVAILGPNVRATLMSINDGSQRGTVFSALTLCDDLGKGFGPSVIVVMIFLFGRRLAFTLAFCCWFITSFILYNLKPHLVRDCHNSSLGIMRGRYD